MATRAEPVTPSTSTNNPSHVRLRLLKTFSLTCDGRSFPVPTTAQRVLAFLALHGGPVRRVQLAGTLWIDVPEDRANGSLRTAVWKLRRLAGPGIEASATDLALSKRVQVDYVEQMSRTDRILRDGSGDTDDLDALCSAGELLPGWYEDWVLAERERFRQVRLLALELLSGHFTATGQIGEATRGALAAVAGDPLRESAHRALINAHLARGNVADAIRQYCVCRQLLATKLGIEPSPVMQELIATVPGAPAALQEIGVTRR